MPFFLTLLFTVFVSAPSFAAINISAEYSPAANVFTILDCIADWWEGFCEDDGEYRKDWIKRHGPLSEADLGLFAQYGKLRERHYNDPDQAEKDVLKNRNGLFATVGSIQADPVAKAFYQEVSVERAIKSLETMLPPNEVDFLRNFYSHFEPKLKPYLLESEKFRAAATTLSRTVNQKRYRTYFDKVRRFYGVSFDIDYKIRFVWWPALKRDHAYALDQYLILCESPGLHLSQSFDDIVFHEIVHTISARQDLQQKQKLTKDFIGTCDPRESLKRGKIIEEPLAVGLGQMLFLDTFDHKRFQSGVENDNWYTDAWINAFSKAIYPDLKAAFAGGQKVTDGIIKKAADACSQLYPKFKKEKSSQP